MVFFIFGAVLLVASFFICRSATKLHNRTLDMLEGIRLEGAAVELKLQELAAREKQAAGVAVEDEPYVRLANGMMGRASEYETRADGQQVRKDRFRVGFGNIVTILVGSRSEYEIDDIVEKVRVIAEAARADYESGGSGVPGSAPVWGPCPADCNEGLVRSGQECEVCDGRAEVVVEQPTAPAEPAAPATPVSLEKEEPSA
jgi:hypothetical protein